MERTKLDRISLWSDGKNFCHTPSISAVERNDDETNEERPASPGDVNDKMCRKQSSGQVIQIHIGNWCDIAWSEAYNYTATF